MPITPVPFELSADDFDRIQRDFPNTGKNADVGKAAVEIVKCYYLSLDNNAGFRNGPGGSDIEIEVRGVPEVEIKGTAKSDIDWNSLRVSSEDCHRLLENGMRIIRVCGIGGQRVLLYYLTHGVDFVMVPEPRWRIQRL